MPSPELVEGEDFYREGPYIVFTEKYLRARGSCCESGCRHCPWGYRRDQRSDVPDIPPDDKRAE
ncbi:MAG TPA: DUF5522 domain-containing protein [Thermoanaerobaculia bacterium]|nr:DUF5522 domain-containing protein [Thermoanaerobaculia bacterium]